METFLGKFVGVMFLVLLFGTATALIIASTPPVTGLPLLLVLGLLSIGAVMAVARKIARVEELYLIEFSWGCPDCGTEGHCGKATSDPDAELDHHELTQMAALVMAQHRRDTGCHGAPHVVSMA